MFKIKLIIAGTDYYHTLEYENNRITLNTILLFLIKNNLMLKDINNHCKFIINDKIMELGVSYLIKDTNNIYITVDNDNMRDRLIKIFDSKDYIMETNEDEINYNNKLMDYFQDKKFITLLDIIKENPEYISIACSYLSNGNIINKIDIDNIEINNDYNIVYEKLKSSVDLSKWDEDYVKKILTYYNGNMNLTMRYLLI
jgi:hypothetical protein